MSEKGEWKHIGHLKTSYKKPKRTEMELSVIKMKDVKDYCTYPECQYVCSKEIASITGRSISAANDSSVFTITEKAPTKTFF